MFKVDYSYYWSFQGTYYTGYSIMTTVVNLYSHACKKLTEGKVGMYGSKIVLHFNGDRKDEGYFMVRKWRSYYV